MINDQKKLLRKQILEIAEKLDKNYKEISSKKIYDLVISTEEYKKANTIFCFVGMENEVDTKSIIQKAFDDGKRVAIPLMISKGIMVAKEIKSLENLVKNNYGIFEPTVDATTIEPDQIDLCILPCLSCSRSGVRLGYGGGYYDRYLQNQSFIKMCICFEKLTSESIPQDKYDEKVDFLVTEIGIYEIK